MPRPPRRLHTHILVCFCCALAKAWPGSNLHVLIGGVQDMIARRALLHHWRTRPERTRHPEEIPKQAG
eukprot:5568798-Pyramimonas_sp.AAC.1